MGQKKFPPLEPREIKQILLARGFVLDRTEGDHEYYVRVVRGKDRVVQIDTGCPLISDYWLKLTIKQSGLTREEFYCSTRGTAKKINKKEASQEEFAQLPS